LEFLSSLHPLVIHFPIAIFLLYIFFEFIGLFKESYSNTAFILLIVGLIFGIIAVLTGNQAAEVLIKTSQIGKNIPKELIEEHENYATLTIWFYFVLAAVRVYFVVNRKFNKKMKIIILLCAIIGYIFVFETAEHGGKLVYNFGAGTNISNKISTEIK